MSEKEKKDDREKNHFEGMRLQGLYDDIVKQDIYDFAIFEVEIFECYLDAMILKIHQKYNGKNGFKDKTPEVEENLQRLEWMKRHLGRFKYIRRIAGVQAGLISSMQMDLRMLENQNVQLMEKIERLKELNGKD